MSAGSPLSGSGLRPAIHPSPRVGLAHRRGAGQPRTLPIGRQSAYLRAMGIHETIELAWQTAPVGRKSAMQNEMFRELHAWLVADVECQIRLRAAGRRTLHLVRPI